MEPHIQYAKTDDGVSIAVFTLGEGKALIGASTGPWGREVEWRDPGFRRWYERLAQKRRIVLYDGRGTGLSERVEEPWSIATETLDLEAVVRHLGLAEFDLIAPSFGGPAVLAYAAAHQEELSHLLLWCAWARTTDAMASSQAKALLALLDQDWQVLTEMMARLVFGWSSGPEAHELAVAVRESISREYMTGYIETMLKTDASEFLEQIKTPTAVFHRRESVIPGLEVARNLAAAIPNARLVLLEGPAVPWMGDMEAAARAFDAFLDGTETASTVQAAPASGGLVTILFTDIEGSTSLTQSMGDQRAQAVLRTHNQIVRRALVAQSGSEIKHTGDGIMASFPLASSAVACAIAIQRALVDREVEPGQPQLRVRIGLNAGEPVVEDEDLFGTAVQLARRVCDVAKAGEIMTSEVVRGLTGGKEFVFADQGRRALKGFDEPVRLYRVEWSESYAAGPTGSKEPTSPLTARETEVLSLLASGHSGKEIALQLMLSLSTVQRHIANIYAKIGARGRVEAAGYAIKHGLVQPRDS